MHVIGRCACDMLQNAPFDTAQQCRYRLTMATKKTAPPPARLARAFALPPPNVPPARSVRVLLSLSEGERDAIAAVAKSRGEPLATTARLLAVHAAQALLAEGK